MRYGICHFRRNAGVGDIMNTTGMLMGVEQALINICIDHEATLHMIDKRLNMQLKRLKEY